ncbi:prepilin-type N-terminal cleavage/methylation domain-containing protein [Cycloclasticus pugetii]|jgi:type II secretory pathway component PulJ|uniref:prepilin-type N-terminal cleavage/methylation domain-containing protein n=1 Tax=Cycloclasticus pugetii TaxID=34068 RepID=UPI0003804FD2|nr:prepilin-type N-terminal cleavage/methylation domain-containing protein [Cycloclasticus pugetii]
MINQRQTGLTLIEMMIAMVLGLFVTAVIITVFSTNVRSSTENIKMIRLNQELRGVMTFMVDELKRAGYSERTTISDFMDKLNAPDPATLPRSCIRYAYDEDADAGAVADTGGINPESREHFGFTLHENTVKWISSGGAIGALGSPTCDTALPWEDLTDPNIAFITTLDFDISGSANTNDVSSLTALTTTTGVSVYDVTITLTGTVDLPPIGPDANDPRRTITETIRLRNDDPKN